METSTLEQMTGDSIASMLAAMRPLPYRSLQDASSILGLETDDDQVIAQMNHLIDPDAVTCILETRELFEDYFGDPDSIDATNMTLVTTSTEIGISGLPTIKTEYTEEYREYIRMVCSSIGGNYELVGDFSCEFTQHPGSDITMHAEYIGLAGCSADIPECKSSTTFEQYAARAIHAKGRCRTPSGFSSVSTPDEADNLSNGSITEQSGAGIGFKISTFHWAMVSILVAAANLL